MRIRDAFGIYHVLETILKRSDRPLTCVELYDNPDVRKFADSTGRVSDYLGHMYRQGLLGREPAPKTPNSQARWGYFWKNRSEVQPKVVQMTAPPANEPTSGGNVVPLQRKVLSKPNIEISDNGGTVVIELAELTITIKTKNN